MQDKPSTPAAPAATGATGNVANQPPSDGSPGQKQPDHPGSVRDIAAKYVPPSASVIVILIVSWFLSGWARRAMRKGLEKAKFDPTLGKFFSNTVRWIILTIGVLFCFNVFGINTTSFAAVLGAAGLAVGLALQGSLGHMAAGVMLLIFRPFKVGDVITVGGQTGTINEIDLFSTTMDSADGRRIIIPNGQVFGTTIENATFHPRRRADVRISVAASNDLDHVRAVLMQAAMGTPGRLPEPGPGVGLVSLAPTQDWDVNVWAKTSELGAVKQALMYSIREELVRTGIEMPVQAMTVTLRQPT